MMENTNTVILANVVLGLLSRAQAYQAKIASGVPVTAADVDEAMLNAAQSHAQLVAAIVEARAAKSPS